MRRTVAFAAELLRSEDSWSILQEFGAGQLTGPAPRATTEGLAASFPRATTEGPAAPRHHRHLARATDIAYLRCTPLPEVHATT